MLAGATSSGSVCHSRSASDWASEGVSDSSLIISGSSSRSWSGMAPFFSGNGSVTKSSSGGVSCGLSSCEILVVGPFEDRGRFSWRGISGLGGVFSLSPEKNIGDGCDEFPIELCLVGVFMLCDLRGKKITIQNNDTKEKLH